MSSIPGVLSSPVPLTKAVIQVLIGAFDAKFYSEEYEDLHLAPQELFAHFIFKGVHEGRSPNKSFDVAEYFANNRDVLLSGMNPFYHFHVHGKHEGRIATSVVRVKQRLAILANQGDINWIETIRPFVDENYYRRQLSSIQPYLTGYDIDLTAHYALLGWKLRLNPSPKFSTSQWLEEHSELSGFRLNPLLLDTLGMCSELVGSMTENSMLKTSVANPFATYEVSGDEVHPSNMSSNADIFLPRSAPTNSSDHSAANQFTADLQGNRADISGHPSVPKSGAASADNKQTESPSDQLSDEVVEKILSSRLFDAHYYLATYLDVADAKVDPFQHFMHQGWREGRDPSAKFSTAYYLATCAGAVAAGLNPLVHYVEKGRMEGRATKPPGGWQVEVLERCIPPAIREASFPSFSGPLLSYEALRTAVFGTTVQAKANSPLPMILAVSHDSYSTVTGGTQIFIADEMSNAVMCGVTHLHIAPSTPGLTIGDANRPTKVIVTKNGAVLGQIEATEVFRLISTTQYLNIRVSIHSLIGFGLAVLEGLRQIAQQTRTYLWLHDYSTLCDGFNLLRNDLAFCGGPGADSVECAVCVYGTERKARQSRLQEWFDRVNPVVVAPSEAALNIWKCASTPLTVASSIVVPHWTLLPTERRKRKKNSPIRVAFVGYAVSSKGWPIFSEIVDTLAHTDTYEFYHFIKGGNSPNSTVKGVDCTVTSTDRLGTSTLMSQNSIDVVMIMSPWPETFSYVAAEALIAGCTIVCFECSGNVAALANKTKQGLIYKGSTELFESVSDGSFHQEISKTIKQSHYHAVTQNRGLFDAIVRME